MNIEALLRKPNECFPKYFFRRYFHHTSIINIMSINAGKYGQNTFKMHWRLSISSTQLNHELVHISLKQSTNSKTIKIVRVISISKGTAVSFFRITRISIRERNIVHDHLLERSQKILKKLWQCKLLHIGSNEGFLT